MRGFDSLAGRLAVVTGGSNGIGAAVVKRLATVKRIACLRAPQDGDARSLRLLNGSPGAVGRHKS
jgi:3-oxoacyl-[acyl-carrier protein] reductase